MVALESLWDDEFKDSEAQRAKELLEKAKKKPKQVKVLTEKSIKSKSVSIEDKLAIIRSNVNRILGVYKENTVVITTRKQFTEYIDAALINGVIAVDTETNNSLDPISCKIMGLCLYTPGQKNAYIPINHVDPRTEEKLSWQLTEKDVYEELSRINALKPEQYETGEAPYWSPDFIGQSYKGWYDIHVKPYIEKSPYEDCQIIFHNAKFDYEVIWFTCGIKLRINWDTLLGAKIIDENEPAGLKWQYVNHIDTSIEKYDIEHLFKGILYAYVEPALFALYAATDSYMTYVLYMWQKRIFEQPENARLYYVFSQIEVPVIEVTASMEMEGVCINEEYSKRLSAKYHRKADDIDKQISEELAKYEGKIAQWRATPEANAPIKAANGKAGKSKAAQLDTPISLASPTQLAILLYDILQIPAVDPKTPRGTGEEFLEAINAKYNMPLCKLILEKRGLEKLIGTYIDKLPECVSPVDHRLHAHFNQYGAGCITGDSLILTNKGYLPIGDLFTGQEANGEFVDTNITIVNRDLNFEKASHRVAYYDYATKKITLRGGLTIEGTYNHPIVCSKLTYADIIGNKSSKQISRLPEGADFKQLADIKVNDIVAVPYGYNIFPSEYQKITDDLVLDENLAELLGMIYVRGTKRRTEKEGLIRIVTSLDETKSRILSLCDALSFNNTLYHQNVEIDCSKIKKAFGCKFPKDFICKDILPIIKQSPRSVICAFIKGTTISERLYYGDKIEYLSIPFVNEHVVQFVQDVLLNIGILFDVEERPFDINDWAKDDAIFDGRYVIQISGDMHQKFLDEIGVENEEFRHPINKESHFLTYNNVYYAPVECVEDSQNTVYDLHIPETHSFISNGMISHNTGRYSSSDPNL